VNTFWLRAVASRHETVQKRALLLATRRATLPPAPPANRAEARSAQIAPRNRQWPTSFVPAMRAHTCFRTLDATKIAHALHQMTGNLVHSRGIPST
jgi:hypothetical protein